MGFMAPRLLPLRMACWNWQSESPTCVSAASIMARIWEPCLHGSGTLGAAFEAVSHGIPAIAISLEAELAIQRSNDFRQTDWDAAKRMLHSWISRVLDRGMPEYVDLININVPAGSGILKNSGSHL